MISLLGYAALVASTDVKEADQFLKALENEKRDVMVPYAKKKIENEIAKKQIPWWFRDKSFLNHCKIFGHQNPGQDSQLF